MTAVLKKLFFSRASARQFAWHAFIVWLMSLAFPAFVGYSEKQVLFGAEVLATGWIALPVLSIAWLANPLFLTALCIVSFGRKSGVGFAIAAAVVSLDTFRFNDIGFPTGGSDIYGYGFGVVLWFVAIGLGLIATRKRERELASNLTPGETDVWVRDGGCWWVFLFATASAVLAVTDRLGASSSEKERLKSVVFKRGIVCRHETSPPAMVLPFDGTLEIVAMGRFTTSPFNAPDKLLEWGIPAVRMKGHDFSVVGTKEDPIIRVAPAKGAPSAVLTTDDDHGKDTSRMVRIRITSADGNSVATEQIWRQNSPYTYCPDYGYSSPKPMEQPRKLVMQALGLQDRPTAIQPARSFWDSVQRFDAIVTRREPASPGDWQVSRAGCAPDVGKHELQLPPLSSAGFPVMLRGTGYYFSENSTAVACSGDFAYLYKATRNQGNYFITIHKRSLKDLTKAWSAHLKISNADVALHEDQPRMLSVEDDGNTLRIRMLHKGRDQTVVIETPAPTAR